MHDLTNRRTTYLVMILALWTFQIGFGSFIVADSLKDMNFTVVPSLKIGLTRFVCGVVMHIQCDKEFQNGLRIMKYSVNHAWKFDNYKLAFLPGFLQIIAMITITLINFLVIMISGEILDIAKDFTALMIIADFDNIFGTFENSNELPKKILSEEEYEFLFKVEKTSS